VVKTGYAFGAFRAGRVACLVAVRCLQDWDTLLEVICFCVRPANRSMCAGPDHPLQERYQAESLEVSIPSCSHESTEDYDSLHTIPSSGANEHVGTIEEGSVQSPEDR
jgi:hypothetical protein